MALYYDITGDGNVERNKVRAGAYWAYLRSVAAYLPAETRDFALSEWYYRDPDKCPHDSWVENCEILEHASGERQQIRELEIRVRLLAASHAGHISFGYRGVFGYEMRFAPFIRVWDSRPVLPKHDDWLSDEITLTSRGNVEHQIRFASGCLWRIEARSISYNYAPLK